MLYQEFKQNLFDDIEKISLSDFTNDEYRFKEFWDKYDSDDKFKIEIIIINCAELINNNILSNCNDGNLNGNDERLLEEYIDDTIKEIGILLIVKL